MINSEYSIQSQRNSSNPQNIIAVEESKSEHLEAQKIMNLKQRKQMIENKIKISYLEHSSINFEKEQSIKFLNEQLNQKAQELTLIKQSINEKLHQNYYHSKNLKEIKRILEEFATKSQLEFCAKQIGVIFEDSQTNQMVRIRLLLSLIDDALNEAHLLVSTKEAGVIPKIKSLCNQRLILAHNNKKYLDYINQLKQYSHKQKEKKNRLQIHASELIQKVEQDSRIIKEIEQVTQKLALKYCNRNELLLMIKFIGSKIKMLEKNDEEES